MKRIILLAAALLISACTGPQTASEFANFPTVSSKTIQISRSFSAVSASLRSGANKCLNKTEQGWVSQRVMNGFGGMQTVQQNLTTRFSTEVATGSGEIQITMRKNISSDYMHEDGYIWLLIEAKSVAGGTSLSIHEAKFADDISAVIQSWAKGGALVCPTLSLS